MHHPIPYLPSLDHSDDSSEYSSSGHSEYDTEDEDWTICEDEDDEEQENEEEQEDEEDDSTCKTESDSSQEDDSDDDMPMLLECANQPDSSSDDSSYEYFSDSEDYGYYSDIVEELFPEEYTQGNTQNLNKCQQLAKTCTPTTHKACTAITLKANSSYARHHKGIPDPDESTLGSASCILNWLCDTGATTHMMPR